MSYISPIRLQILAKKYSDYLAKPFSDFSATLNEVADIRTKWAVLIKVSPLKFRPSGKSKLRSLENPSMIYFRLRSFLGVGARSDVLAYLLVENQGDFAISDLMEIGYSKRSLAKVLSDLAGAGILSETQVRNQFRYTFTRRNQFIKLVGGIPKKMVYWDRLLAVLLPIRACLRDVEDAPVGVSVIDMRNLLNKLSNQLAQLELTPPPLQKDFEAYWSDVTKWILDFFRNLSGENAKVTGGSEV